MLDNQVALITGGAKRIGAHLAQALHAQGMRIVIHYHQSEEAAKQLCKAFNQTRPQSAVSIQADLQNPATLPQLMTLATTTWGRLDVLINNAASFHDTPLPDLTPTLWHSTLNSNLTAPVFLALEAFPHLKKTQGCIINMADIRATQPLKNYTAYCISKAGLVMATKSLAIEWAPYIRVNAIAPGVVLWSDESPREADQAFQQKIMNRTPMKRTGTPEDIVKAAIFLIKDAPYMTGQVLTVDGGRSLAY